jgi:hypothetical protein
MSLDEEDGFIQRIMANRDAAVAAAAKSTTYTATSEGTLVGGCGFCPIQQVNSTPPLSSYNRFACLEVDTLIESHTCVAKSTKVVQTPSHPPIPNRRSCLPAWEHRLPIKYVVTASPVII